MAEEHEQESIKALLEINEKLMKENELLATKCSALRVAARLNSELTNDDIQEIIDAQNVNLLPETPYAYQHMMMRKNFRSIPTPNLHRGTYDQPYEQTILGGPPNHLNPGSITVTADSSVKPVPFDPLKII